MNTIRFAVVLTLWSLFLLGCNKPEEIERYTVDKLPASTPPESTASSPAPASPAAAASSAAKDRMLAAIVVDGSQGWFFKVTGPKDALEAKTDQFHAFIKSLKFADGKPQWTLPDGWAEQPGSAMRFATLQLGAGEPPLELSVIGLPKQGVADDEYALMNINRWRGQMQLPPITVEQLPAETTTLQLEGTQATLVNLIGSAAPGGMGGGPFSGRPGDGK